MARNKAPIEPNELFQFIDGRGRLTPNGLEVVRQMWRQISAGFTIVPCSAAFASNVYTLTPTLHEEGGRTYGFGMGWIFEAPSSSTGSVTAGIGTLTALKVYKTDGAAQAGSGDIVANSMYLLFYSANLDSGAGGLVMK